MSKLVVKIGGSVATNKHDMRAPEVVVESIKKCLDKIDILNLKALVFGVGSFGHNKALKLGLKEIPDNVDYKKITNFVDHLNTYYKEVMEIVSLYSDKFKFVPIKTVKDFEQIHIESGTIPVYFGSVIDDHGKAVVLSGDSIVAKIAGSCDILFCTDVFGVSLNSGEVVEEFKAEDLDRLIQDSVDDGMIDATGGMSGKLQKLKKFGFKNSVVFRNIDQT
jgi:isopentenyl phosphate kinase